MEAQRERTTWISKLLPKGAPSPASFAVNSGVTSSWVNFTGSWADQNMEITEIQMSALEKGDPWGHTAPVGLAWPQTRIFLVTSTSAITWPTRKIQPGMCALGYLHRTTAQGVQLLTEKTCSPGKQETHLGRRRIHSIYLSLFVHNSSLMTVEAAWATQGLFELKE